MKGTEGSNSCLWQVLQKPVLKEISLLIASPGAPTGARLNQATRQTKTASQLGQRECRLIGLVDLGPLSLFAI
jgi:hypothetical protein